MRARQVIDISPLLSSRIAVFPGDQRFERSLALDFAHGHHLQLSSIHTTLHVGAHADAPSHYHASGVSIEKRDLTRYLGPCQLITVELGPDERIMPRHLLGKEITAERILFRTRSFADPNQWYRAFNSLSPELIDWLADQGVILVGIDTPSVDPAESKALETHTRIFERDLSILEGLVLEHAQDGLYDLIALPLRIEGGDASPVRAVLLKAGELPL